MSKRDKGHTEQYFELNLSHLLTQKSINKNNEATLMLNTTFEFVVINIIYDRTISTYKIHFITISI